MTDWQRLEQVIKWTGLSTNAFATGIGLKRSENLYQIKRGNNRISKNLAELIVRKYGSVNRAWLLTGEIYLAVTPEFALMRYMQLDREGGDRLWLAGPAGGTVEPVGVRRERIVRLYLVKGILIHKVL